MRVSPFALCMTVAIVTAGIWGQTVAPSNPPRISLSEAEMTAKIIRRVAPVYPSLARAAHIEGSVVLQAIVGKDGSFVSMQALSGHPLLIRAALESLPQWRYQPTIVNGEAVEVSTTVTVTFRLSDAVTPASAPSSNAPSSATPVDTNATLPETVRLKNGRIIHADTASEAGDKIEYTVGESVYEIPKSLVQEISRAANAPPSPSQDTTVDNSNVVTAPSLKKMPVGYGDDPKNWYLYESTEQLREECRNDQFANRLHPEFQSKSNFPVSQQEAQMTCASLAVHMDAAYERLVDRGVELQQILCTAGHGSTSTIRSTDPAIAANQEEMGRIAVDLRKRITDLLHQQSADRAQGMRMMIDSYRLAGTCGHGM